MRVEKCTSDLERQRVQKSREMERAEELRLMRREADRLAYM